MKKPKPSTPPYPWPEGQDPLIAEDWQVSVTVVGNSYKVTVCSGALCVTPARYPRSLARAQRIGARMLRRERRKVHRELQLTIQLAQATGNWTRVPPRHRPKG